MKFPIVYCDPNWDYNSRCTWSDTRFGGGVHNHYETDSGQDMASWAEQFLAMRPGSYEVVDGKIKDKPEPGIMLMWVTGPHIETALPLMRAWGYTPIKPVFYWVKTYPGGPNIYYGPGAYTGSNVEFILLGQANPDNCFTPKKSGGTKGVTEVVYAPHPRDDGKKIIHSRKPAIFRDMITRLWGDHPRVEVFARERVPGWHAIGDQLPGGQPIQAGKVIEPLPPVTLAEALTKLGKGFEQPPLLEWGA